MRISIASFDISFKNKVVRPRDDVSYGSVAKNLRRYYYLACKGLFSTSLNSFQRVIDKSFEACIILATSTFYHFGSLPNRQLQTLDCWLAYWVVNCYIDPESFVILQMVLVDVQLQVNDTSTAATSTAQRLTVALSFDICQHPSNRLPNVQWSYKHLVGTASIVASQVRS